MRHVADHWFCAPCERAITLGTGFPSTTFGYLLTRWSRLMRGYTALVPAFRTDSEGRPRGVRLGISNARAYERCTRCDCCPPGVRYKFKGMLDAECECELL